MRKSWKQYESIMKAHTKNGKMDLHPEVQEGIKFGVGLFYYIVSLGIFLIFNNIF